MLGGLFSSNTAQRVGPFNAVQVITTATFSEWSEADYSDTAGGNAMTGVAFPVGTWLYGHIKSFTLTSGSVRAYKV
jgi:hypothetical protein